MPKPRLNKFNVYVLKFCQLVDNDWYYMVVKHLDEPGM